MNIRLLRKVRLVELGREVGRKALPAKAAAANK